MSRKRWVAVGLVLLVGMAIFMVLPSVGSRTPNWRIMSVINLGELGKSIGNTRRKTEPSLPVQSSTSKASRS